jgi:SET domain-containing protein
LNEKKVLDRGVISPEHAELYVKYKRFGCLFPVYSFLNHSCVRNTEHFSIGNFHFIVTTDDIKQGEELTTGYYSGSY